MSPSTLMIVNLISPDKRYDSTFLSNYATIYIKDERRARRHRGHPNLIDKQPRSTAPALARPRQDSGHHLNADVVNAINAQNLQVVAGQVGQPPSTKAQQFQLTINTLGRLADPEQFADIILKTANGKSSPGTSGGMTSTLSDAHRNSPRTHPTRARSRPPPAYPAQERLHRRSRRPTGPRWSSARSSTIKPVPSTACRPSPWPSSSCPAPTLSTWPNES